MRYMQWVLVGLVVGKFLIGSARVGCTPLGSPQVTCSLRLLGGPVVEDHECLSRVIMAESCHPSGASQALGISVGLGSWVDGHTVSGQWR